MFCRKLRTFFEKLTVEKTAAGAKSVVLGN